MQLAIVFPMFWGREKKEIYKQELKQKKQEIGAAVKMHENLLKLSNFVKKVNHPLNSSSNKKSKKLCTLKKNDDLQSAQELLEAKIKE